MNHITDSFASYISNFSSIFNSTTSAIANNVGKNFNFDVDQFLGSLTEINSTLSCHIVLILDQVYAGHFSEYFNLVLEKLSSGFWFFVDWLEVSDFQLRLLREVGTHRAKSLPEVPFQVSVKNCYMTGKF